jgi:hypothetical protein
MLQYSYFTNALFRMLHIHWSWRSFELQEHGIDKIFTWKRKLYFFLFSQKIVKVVNTSRKFLDPFVSTFRLQCVFLEPVFCIVIKKIELHV